MNTQPTIRVSFEHKVNREWVTVDAMAWHDSEGIYKVAIDRVWLGEECVNGLLSEDTLSDIECAIEPAIIEDSRDSRDDFNPERDAFKLGE